MDGNRILLRLGGFAAVAVVFAVGVAAAQTLVPGTRPADPLAPVAPASPLAPGPSIADEVFTVTGVDVDVSGESISAARERAFVEGQRLAVRRLADTLAASGVRLDANTLSDAEVTGLVQGFEVNEEVTSPGRYRADLTFVFRRDAVLARTVASAAVPAVAAPSLPGVIEPPPVAGAPILAPAVPVEPANRTNLILPLLREASGPRLWDAPNPWFNAWMNYSPDPGDPAVIVPLGDLADVSDVSAEAALGGDRQALDRIGQRYDAGTVVVAIAEPTAGGLSVVLNPYVSGGAASPRTLSVSSDAPEGLFDDAVRQVLEDLGTAPPAVAAAPPPAVSLPPGAERIAALVPFGSRAEWFQRRRQLLATGAAQVIVVSLAPNEAIVELAFADRFQLQNALAGQGLALEQAGNTWLLRPNRGGGPPAPGSLAPISP